MFRTISNRSRLTETSIALSLVATLSLVGCGTDISTAPSYVSIESDDGASDGELPVPVRTRENVPAPAALTLLGINAHGGSLTWTAPVAGLTAHIQLDGVRIASVSASDQGYTDTLAKRPGMHLYGVCFEASNKKVSRMMFIEGEVTAGPNDGGRTDDRPEDGR